MAVMDLAELVQVLAEIYTTAMLKVLTSSVLILLAGLVEMLVE
jgi:hypothetical protein